MDRSRLGRRRTLATVAGVAGTAIAGCAGLGRDDADPGADDPDGMEPEGDDELRVVAPEPLVRPAEGPARWLADAFEDRHEDVELVWVSPEAGVDRYLRQAELDAPIAEDCYLGLSPVDVVRTGLSPESILRPLERDRVDPRNRLEPAFRLGDPDGRVVPVLGDYAGLFHDARIDPPSALPGLTGERFGDAVLAQDPRTSTLGAAVLSWTARATDGAVQSYWADLVERRVQVFADWSTSFAAYLDGAGSVLFARASGRLDVSGEDPGDGQDPRRLLVAYPAGRGHPIPSFAGVFADSDRPDLAHAFVAFLLEPTTQAELARRADRFPAVTDAPTDWVDAADALPRVPPATVPLDYGRLADGWDDWLAAWERAVEEG